MKITILGPQGSGKTTQAKLLANWLNAPLIDIGDLIRESCKVEADFNRQACSLMKEGKLVPDEYASEILKLRLSMNDCRNGYVLDGYPRSIEQLYMYDPYVSNVFFINISDKTAVNRLRARGRVDDTPEGIKNRLSWYHEKTSKVLDYYRGLGRLVEIDGEKDKEDVFNQITSHMNAS
ncbi:hypothetical protein A2716_04600 [candidate division WWE3 bacterium RIFCSPHIGHO2_01_FULL_40_23]|uniref:Adenylate kinase n=1 Tax=candidate division WWE3 bacterium RIFCSPLOWO2_01_FULL_41_18 TaxID=1802625 RepID=A0A1F4VD49_UNCKA|nr:MAG: hypothetical protein A2716_04600 [candidate division WWE3 bacterium RIFCSPHIGHO2_01_FULL_40_23]OGC55151.1 MAG: hypothetical protein A3A78_04210 [candidate division WWE3 bacterium RIFCSPLOWO2_01_FULL_41_18]